MSTREYRESGRGFRVRATKRGYHNGQYEVTSPPKTRMDYHDIYNLAEALKRARVAMGELA